MMTGTCDICKSTGETIKYVKDKREYNLCRDCLKKALHVWGMSKLFCNTVAFSKECLEDCKKYMRGEER